MKRWPAQLILSFLVFGSATWTQAVERVVNIPTRPGVTQSFLLASPAHANAAVIFFAGGPDGLVLTSTILKAEVGRPVPEMNLKRISIPVLVVHHRQDGCEHTPYAEIPRLMAGLSASPRKELLTFAGGQSRQNPCSALT